MLSSFGALFDDPGLMNDAIAEAAWNTKQFVPKVCIVEEGEGDDEQKQS